MLRTARRSRRIVGLMLALLTGGCNGGGASAPPFATGAAAGPVSGVAGPLAIPFGPQAGSLQLPAGSLLDPSTLTVSNSLGHAAVTHAASFSLTAFTTGPQLTFVKDASGNILLMGWLGPQEPAINAHTTAEVLAYYALAIFALPSDLRKHAIDLIPATPGLNAVELAIAKALAANPATFSLNDPTINNALIALAAPLRPTTSAARAPAATRHIRGIAVENGDEKSGITPINDFPNGIHFQNRFRRAAHVFVDRLSIEVSPNHQVESPFSLTQQPIFQIQSIVALNGLTGTLIDIFNGKFAASEIVTPSIALPNVPGALSTRYQLTLVGPGANLGDYAKLSPAQITEQIWTSTSFVITNFYLPLVLSVVLPNASIDKITGEGTTAVLTDFITSLMQASPQIAQLSAAGDMRGALFATKDAVLSSSILRTLFENTIVRLIIGATGDLDAADNALKAAGPLSAALKTVDTTLGVLDATMFTASMRLSNAADIFYVKVMPDNVVLTPSSASTVNVGIVNLTATIPTATGSGQPLTYRWSNTATVGHIWDGQNQHVGHDSFESTLSTISYTANVSGTGTDTITVEAFVGPVSQGNSLGRATSTVSVAASSSDISYHYKNLKFPDSPNIIVDELLSAGNGVLTIDKISASLAKDGSYDSEVHETYQIPKRGPPFSGVAFTAPPPQLSVLHIVGSFTDHVQYIIATGGTPCTSDCTIDNQASAVDVYFPDESSAKDAAVKLKAWQQTP